MKFVGKDMVLLVFFDSLAKVLLSVRNAFLAVYGRDLFLDVCHFVTSSTLCISLKIGL